MPLISGDTTFCEDGATTPTAEAGFPSCPSDGTTITGMTVSQPGIYTVTKNFQPGLPWQNSIAGALCHCLHLLSRGYGILPGSKRHLEGPAGLRYLRLVEQRYNANHLSL